MGEKLESIVLASLKLEIFHLSWISIFSNFIFTNDISNFPT